MSGREPLKIDVIVKLRKFAGEREAEYKSKKRARKGKLRDIVDETTCGSALDSTAISFKLGSAAPSSAYWFERGFWLNAHCRSEAAQCRGEITWKSFRR